VRTDEAAALVTKRAKHLIESIQGRENIAHSPWTQTPQLCWHSGGQQLRANDSEHQRDDTRGECCVPSSPSQNSTVSTLVCTAIIVTVICLATKHGQPATFSSLPGFTRIGACWRLHRLFDSPFTSLLASNYIPIRKRTATNNHVQPIVALFHHSCRSQMPSHCWCWLE